ncbi:MAG: tetratricopeptide repeat protein [Alphaproteobacteria bacterium]
MSLPPENIHRSVSSGWALMRAGNSQGAIREFRAALASDPEHVDGLIGLCQSYLNLGQNTEASETAAALLRVAPDLATAHRLQAECLRQRKKRHEAVAAAKEAIRLDPREPSGYHILALAYFDERKYRAALKIVREGRAVAPAYPVLIAQEALILLQTKGGKAAEPLADEALRLGMDSQYVTIIAARIAIMRNQLERARDLLDVVLRRDANNEAAISLYLLSDRRRYGMLRARAQFPNWRKEHGVLGWIVWSLAVLALIVSVGVVTVVTHAPGIVVGLSYSLFWQWQYRSHRKAVKAHFAQPVLRPGF